MIQDFRPIKDSRLVNDSKSTEGVRLMKDPRTEGHSKTRTNDKLDKKIIYFSASVTIHQTG